MLTVPLVVVLGLHVLDEVDNPAGVGELVVVPGDHLKIQISVTCI